MMGQLPGEFPRAQNEAPGGDFPISACIVTHRYN